MTRRLAFSCAAAQLLVPTLALAAGGETSVLDGLVYPAINLLLLLAVLFFVARKPIAAFFQQRSDQIREDLDSASRLHDQAEEKLTEWQGKLAEIEREIERIRTTARERAEAEREAILADGNAAADRIRRDAQAAIDQELRRSRETLRAEAAELALELATSLLSAQVNDADRDRLLEEFIERVERAPGANGSGHG